MDHRTWKKIRASVKLQALCPSHYDALITIALDLYREGTRASQTGALAQQIYNLAATAAGNTGDTQLVPSQNGFYAHAAQVMWVYKNQGEARKLTTRALQSFSQKRR